MWNTVTQFAQEHPFWATFLALWVGAFAFGIGCDIVRAFRNEPHIVSPNGHPMWDDDV